MRAPWGRGCHLRGRKWFSRTRTCRCLGLGLAAPSAVRGRCWRRPSPHPRCRARSAPVRTGEKEGLGRRGTTYWHRVVTEKWEKGRGSRRKGAGLGTVGPMWPRTRDGSRVCEHRPAPRGAPAVWAPDVLAERQPLSQTLVCAAGRLADAPGGTEPPTRGPEGRAGPGGAGAAHTASRGPPPRSPPLPRPGLTSGRLSLLWVPSWGPPDFLLPRPSK